MLPVPGVWGVVVAAGSGERYGGAKQFETLKGRTVVEWSVVTCKRACEGVIVVLPPGPTDPRFGDRRFGADIAVAGGASRSASVRNALNSVPPDATAVVVHDAARPLAGIELYERVITTLADSDADGVICALPLSDTLKRVSGDPAYVSATLDREGLVLVQTPQAFEAEILRRAHATGEDATDDSGLVELVGGSVTVVPGDMRNVKITTPADLAYCKYLLAGSR
ncbi:MAG: 2-C-methyl-D-erythritol 4-phosphate cytidylyltransferase [Actinobacteria bacterium]|nr:2-C-methyl-D-erythritol 4-phosphate cytidylyltransferase [Actinomycetota bacterium]MCL5445136.1 2-C-methyl-D-erythritol 4-phosphate cytidylyltransferase [Actinomycetota bacterium]